MEPSDRNPFDHQRPGVYAIVAYVDGAVEGLDRRTETAGILRAQLEDGLAGGHFFAGFSETEHAGYRAHWIRFLGSTRTEAPRSDTNRQTVEPGDPT